MTVQTSWRPQLPLPKEVVDIDNNSCGMDKNQKKESSSKKWSFGRFFRRKKEIETESSSEEDRKAGFIPQKPRKKDKKRRESKIAGTGCDHIVISPKEEIFLPFETIDSNDLSRSTNSIEKRARRERKKTARLAQCQSSSEDELVSLNSSSISKYRSDESIGSGGIVANSRKSRAARNERYLKRISRDENGNSPMMQITQQVGRWKSQPVQNFNYSHKSQQPSIYGVKSSSSLTNMPISNLQPPNRITGFKKRNQNEVSQDKRSISYDNHIHLQNRNPPKEQVKSSPPPPPPRDPQRRLNVSHNELRPISYAFDQSATPLYAISNRCVSDDKLWGPNGSIYQTTGIQRPSSTQPVAQQRRFITRTPSDQNQNSHKQVPFGQDYKYVADAVPRSRKPIHIVNQEETKSPQIITQPSALISTPLIRTTKSGLPPQMQAASDFWKRIDQAHSSRRGREPKLNLDESYKPRSISSSRASELRHFRNPMFDSIYKNQNPLRNRSTEEVDSVVKGSLFIKPAKDNEKNVLEISSNGGNKKSSSMPNYYQPHNRSTFVQKPLTPPPNRYDEYVAKRKGIKIANPNNFELRKPKVPPTPPERKSFRLSTATDDSSTHDLKKSTTNLEDAINELEAIYKSLKLGDEDLLDRAERRDIPTPTDFEKYAKLEEINDEDDEETGEPDVVKDDVVYRNLKRANTSLKTTEPQPPFGIPIGPIPPSPNTDYLHVSPEKDSKKVRCSSQHYPDLVTDDMAVRNLRKDPPGADKPTFLYPSGSLKKKRATRTQSANIYTLIQRDAAKPSGGNLYDYFDFDKSLNKSGSLSDVRKETEDVPSTLFLIRSIQSEDQKQKSNSSVFRHPSEGGAVYNLPTVLSKLPSDTTSSSLPHKTPVPLPRKSITPEPSEQNRSGIEEVLNQIAKEAKESSEKLSRELQELRKEALSKSSSPKNGTLTPPEVTKDIKAIEEVSQAARRYEELLLDIIPPEPKLKETIPTQILPKRLENEQKYLNDINKVSEAAKICEIKLQEAVLSKPESSNQPSNQVDSVEIVIKVGSLLPQKNTTEETDSVVATLLQKLDPGSDKISEIAARCMRQISELGDLKDEVVSTEMTEQTGSPDYDNLNSDIGAAACKPDSDYANISNDSVIVPGHSVSAEDEEEIDKIMKECEQQALDNSSTNHHKLSTDENRTSDEAIGCAFSSSDCLKSSSPTPSGHQSSSITSIHAFSSSDFVKSSTSSDFNTPSTDPIKTFSTTSYDVKSTSVTPNITNSPYSTTPSPPLNLTPVGNGIGSPSQYNSSEELAMIFGINESPVTTTGSTATTATGNEKLAIANSAKNNIAAATTSITTMAENIYSKPCQPSYHLELPSDKIFDCAANLNVANNNCSRHVKLATMTSSLDTIPELHDCVESVKNCMTDAIKIDQNEFHNFSNNASNMVSNDCTKNIETQFDSISSTDESNPDSGNVSLSDFPVHHQINTTLELSLLHNSRFKCSNLYPFINQIQIITSDGAAVESVEEADGEASLVFNSTNTHESYDSVISEKTDSSSTGTEEQKSDNKSVQNIDKIHFPDCSTVDKKIELRSRMPRSRNTSPNCTPSTSNAPSKSLILRDNRQSFIEHIVIACTFGIASNDVYTFLAIVVAVITIIALVLL